MERFDRIFRLNQILQNARVPVSHKTLEAELECSRATVTRIIEDLRDYLGAPLIYDREANGYRYDGEGEHPYQLPGLWFSEAELHALLTMQQLLADLQPGLLDDQLAPLRERVEVLLQDRASAATARSAAGCGFSAWRPGRRGSVSGRWPRACSNAGACA